MANKLPQVTLNELCQVKAWRLKYDDLQTESHWPQLMSLPVEEQRNHPLYKTMRCTAADQGWLLGSGCPRGDACAFAHSEDELRELPAERSTQSWRLRLVVSTPDGTLEFENDHAFPTQREAKSALAEHCLAYLDRQGSGLPRTTQPSLSKRQTNRILAICRAICRTNFMCEAAQRGHQAWLVSLGGTLGSQYPDLIASIRDSPAYGSWTAFVNRHRNELPVPVPTPPLTTRESDVAVAENQPSQTHDDPVIEYLNGKTLSTIHESWNGSPHAIVLAAVQSSSNGVDVKDLKLQLDELFAYAGRTVKTLRLSLYLQAFPDFFRFEGDQHSQRVFTWHSQDDRDSFSPQDFPALSGSSQPVLDEPEEGLDSHLETAPHPSTADPTPPPDNSPETDISSIESLRAYIRDLEAQLEVMQAKEEMRLCHICMDAPQDVTLFPCLHAMFCSSCIKPGASWTPGSPVSGVSSCPICRTPLSGALVMRLGM